MTKRYLKISMLSIVVFFLITMLILNPKKYTHSITLGYTLFLSKVFITSFPFFFLSKLFIELPKNKSNNFIKNIFCKIYKTSYVSFDIFMLSILSGYPTNAKLISDYYTKGYISKNEAKKILSFTSTSGPLFIIGTLGSIILDNVKVGYILYIAHIISALLNGLLYRKINIQSQPCNIEIKQKKNILLDCMLDTVKALCIVGGYITIFYMIIDILIDIHLIDFFTNILSKIFPSQLSKIIATSFFELTRGLSLIESYEKSTLAIIAGCVSFSSISILVQSYAFLQKAKIRIRYFLCTKLTQTIISIAITYILLLI